MDPVQLSVREVLAGKAPKEAPVTVKGWVRTRRDSKAGFSFIHLSDGSSFHPVQIVVPNQVSNYGEEILRLTSGCAIEATGTIVPSPAKGQPFEMQASAVKVVGWVEDPEHYPIQPKAHSLEFLREVAHLRPRTNVIGAATRVRHTLAQAIHRFFHEQGFFWVNTPIITAADAEGAGALFRVSTLDLANLPGARTTRSISRKTSSAARPSSPSRASSTSRPTASRSPGSTPSARPSAPRTPTPAGTSRNSGWSSPRSPLRT